MRTRSRRRSNQPSWSVPVVGLALESITSWQPPMAERPNLSPRVRLEIDILSSEQLAPPVPVPVLARSEVRVRSTVLLVSSEAEVRGHLRACLQDQPKLRLIEVDSVSAADALASEVQVHLIIADPGAASVTRAQPAVRTILLADDPAGLHSTAPGPMQHVMQRPFSAETLAATVLLLLSESTRR
jgi:hypothetical protein